MIARRLVLKTVLMLGLVLSSVVPAWADATEQQAKDMVNNLAKQAVQIMTGKNIADADRIQRFRTLFISSVDVPVVSRFVLGRHWKNASPDQQQDFMKLFEDMLVYTWSNRFKEANDNITIRVDGVRTDADQNSVIVETAILREGQEPVPVLWRLRSSDGVLRIQDLLIEGTSMIVTYREEYASVISQGGGNINGLLDVLRKKTTAMAQQQGLAKAN